MADTFINLPSNGAGNYREPTANFASLPLTGNSDGDVRVALDTGAIYVWHQATTSWVSATGGSGLTNLNGQTGGSQSFAVGSSGTNFNISSSGNTHTFNIPDASAANRGVITTGTQTLAGDKTFSGLVILSGGVSGISQYKVEKFTLGAGQIAAKEVTLAATPTSPTLTRLIPINGIEADYSVDFTVSGTTLSWDTLSLDGVLEVGDKLIVVYG